MESIPSPSNSIEKLLIWQITWEAEDLNQKQNFFTSRNPTGLQYEKLFFIKQFTSV